MRRLLLVFWLVFWVSGCASSNVTIKKESPVGKIRKICRDLTDQYSKSKSDFLSGPVAVLSAYGEGEKHYQFGEVLSDTYTSEMFKRGIKVVERQRIKKVIDELEYQTSAAFNQEKTAKLGNVLGASIIGVGVLKTIGDEISISYRFLETKTAKVLAVAEGVVDKSMLEGLFTKSVNGVYKLKSLRVTVQSSKANRHYWDPSSKTGIDLPDVLVYLRIGNNDTIKVREADTLDAQWHWREGRQSALISYDERDPVKIWVWDEDFMFDDDIGSVQLEHGFKTDQVLAGQVIIGAFGRVKEVRISLERVE